LEGATVFQDSGAILRRYRVAATKEEAIIHANDASIVGRLD
jgi:hypothetical protein